jgi:beta-1,4-mannosyl-glycoprotein beta-1,4-N-acetylglucosaminyltransferase
MKIYDCFTYYNESNLMQIRFEELKDVVDHFVIIEADQTFTGNPKGFYFDDLPEWINDYEDKVIRFTFSFPKEDMTSWEREFFQRNVILDGLSQMHLDDDDIILISDADEIPRASVVQQLDQQDLPSRLDVSQYFWSFHWKVPDHCNQGARPVACRFSDLKEKGAQNLRGSTEPIIPDAGWHFSFFGEINKIKNKIESFAHTEYDSPEFKNADQVMYRIQNGIDPFDRFPLKYYDIDETYPKWVIDSYLS